MQNLSIPGADAARINRLQVPAFKPSTCDAVVLIAGANDVQEYHSPGRFRSDVTSLLDAVRKKDARAAVVVIGLPDVALSPRIPLAVKPFIEYLSQSDNAILQREASEHRAAFVALYAVSQRAIAGGWKILSADNLHPNDFGYAIMASATIPELDRELPRAAPK